MSQLPSKFLKSKLMLSTLLISSAVVTNVQAFNEVATTDGYEMYQSELDQLELTQLVKVSINEPTHQTLYWSKESSENISLISCALTHIQTPYLVTQQNSFEACIVNNFNVEIINDQLNTADLPKLSIDTQVLSQPTEQLDDTVISEHHISWLVPKNDTDDTSFANILAEGFVIELPSRGEVLINNVRIYPGDTGFSVQGKLVGEEFSNVFLHFNGQYWNGSIHSQNTVFTLSAETESQLLLQQRQLTEFDGHDDEVEQIETELYNNQDTSLHQPIAAAPTTIDIVVVYSSVYADRFSDDSQIQAAIETRVAEANVIYQNSNINQKVVLLGYKEISLSDSVRSGSDVANSSEARDMRDEYGADLVSFWTVNGSAGSAQNYSGSSSHAYNTSRKNDIETRYTFVHELGHSMGAKHDRQTYVEQGRGNELTPSLYKYGKSFTNYRTVMSYDNCPSGNSCNRIMHFTNPDIDYSGVATGVAADPNNPISDQINGPADNARRLNETRASIANFKTRKKIYKEDDVVIIEGLWQVDVTYVKGDEVSHNDTMYVARWGSTGKVPGVSRPWAEIIEGGWDVNVAYIKGDEVIHEGNAYIARWSNKGKKPGVSKSWAEIIEGGWDVNVAYIKGDEVIHEGTTYIARWSHQGKKPGVSKPGVSKPWAEVVVAGNWTATEKYSKDAEVIHNGLTYIAKWGQTGKIPGQSNAWLEVLVIKDGDAWLALANYSAGNVVIHNGITYIAARAHTGETPGQSSAWTEVIIIGTDIWGSTEIYVGGDTVIHQGVTYTAEWWTQGNEPGTDSVWTKD